MLKSLINITKPNGWLNILRNRKMVHLHHLIKCVSEVFFVAIKVSLNYEKLAKLSTKTYVENNKIT